MKFQFCHFCFKLRNDYFRDKEMRANTLVGQNQIIQLIFTSSAFIYDKIESFHMPWFTWSQNANECGGLFSDANNNITMLACYSGDHYLKSCAYWMNPLNWKIEIRFDARQTLKKCFSFNWLTKITKYELNKLFFI